MAGLETERFENKQLKVKFDYPATWEIEDLTEKYVKVVSRKYPDEDPWQEYVMVEPFESDLPLDVVVGQSVVPKYAEKEGYEYGDIAYDNIGGSGGLDARRFEFSYQRSGEGKMKAIVLTVKEGKQGVYIQYFAQEHNYSKYKAVGYDTIKGSFTFI